MAGWSGLRHFRPRRRRRPSTTPVDPGQDEVQVAEHAGRSRTVAAAQWRWTGVSIDPGAAAQSEPSAVVIHARRAGDRPPADPPPAA
jgi:hypothetical protein